MNLMQCHTQWASRPADERFLSLDEMQAKLDAVRARTRALVTHTRAFDVQPVEDKEHRALALVSRDHGTSVGPTHWAFGQLAQLAGAPAGYLRTLPAPMVADCLTYGLQVSRSVEDVGLLMTRDESGAIQLRAATGPNYGRIWNADIVRALRGRFGDGVSGDFRVPGEFGQRVEVTRDNTTLYASDRDMFVFLADEEHRIDMPNRRDGKAGSFARGFFVWNSEVGARFVDEVAPALERYARSETQSVRAAIEDARSNKIGDVDEFLRQRKFSGRVVDAIKAAHVDDEGRPIETRWDAITGITAYARTIENQDNRVKVEREAGELLAA